MLPWLPQIETVKTIVISVLIAGVATLLVSYKHQLDDSEKEIATLNREAASLRDANDDNLLTISQLRTNLEEIEKQKDKLTADLNNAKVYQVTLEEKLRKHDLEQLASAKPGLIETRINNATQQVFKDLTDITATQ